MLALKETQFAKRVQSQGAPLDLHAHPLSPLHPGDLLALQGLTGHHPKKWSSIGRVVDKLHFDAYLIKVDGSNCLTKRNRRFLRPLTVRPIQPRMPPPYYPPPVPPQPGAPQAPPGQEATPPLPGPSSQPTARPAPASRAPLSDFHQFEYLGTKKFACSLFIHIPIEYVANIPLKHFKPDPLWVNESNLPPPTQWTQKSNFWTRVNNLSQLCPFLEIGVSFERSCNADEES